MIDRPFKDKDIPWRWKITEEEKLKYDLYLREIVVVRLKHVPTRCAVVLYGYYPSGIWTIIDSSELIIAELVHQLATERERCRKEEVEPLMAVAQDTLWEAEANWASAGYHSASRYRRDVQFYRDLIASVEKAQKENPCF
jgi:hypothetical protein